MSKNKTQFIINLIKLPHGFAFESLDQPQVSVSKKKNATKSNPKISTSRTLNHRIARELALDLQQPSEALPSIPEASEVQKKALLVEPQEQISVQIKRESGLPESPATWFQQSGVHDIEKLGVPQFFTGKGYRTPELYMKYRNFIVGAYRRNPNQYLTKIACRRVLRGDVTSIMKVHSFLQKVGLINFCISKDGDYSFSSSIFSRAITPQPRFPSINKIPETDEEITDNPIDTSNLTATFVNKCFSKSYRVFCSKCQAVCGVLWYQRKADGEKEDAEICLQCYQNLAEGEHEKYSKSDIIKRAEAGTSKQSKSIAWSIEDNMHLLEFVSEKQKSWSYLQKQIFDEKKNFDEIMLQFMQFPISNFEYRDKPNPSPIRDPLPEHMTKLVSRCQSSSYWEEGLTQEQQKSQNPDFCSAMKSAFEKICTKYETKMENLTRESNMMESQMFDLRLLAGPARRMRSFGEKVEVMKKMKSEGSDSEGSHSEVSKNEEDYEEEGSEEEQDPILSEFNFNYS